MANLTTQPIQVTGITPTLVAPGASGDFITPGDHTFIEVNNGSGSSINATLETPGTDQFGSPAADLVTAVPAGARRLIGPVSRKFAAPSGANRGKAKLTTSSQASVTVGAFSV